MSTDTFYWYDFETFGISPSIDRPCQFAGVRTDHEFNIVGEPLMIYCKIPDDYLPDPESTVITGITPQHANQHGLIEAEFSRLIHQELSIAGTCGVGFNSIRFDDEVVRFLFYRNFLDPYAREWQKGNSRWDVFNLVRATFALRPEGIQWPVNDEGRVTLKLEALTRANGLTHAHAHDALSDVYATIAIARLIKSVQPRLFDFLFKLRSKDEVSRLLQMGSLQPVVHVSSHYSLERQYTGVIVPLTFGHHNDKEVIAINLCDDPSILLELNEQALRDVLFTPNRLLAPGQSKPPVSTFQINKCPILAPLNALRPSDIERLNLKMDEIESHGNWVREHQQSLADKLQRVYIPSVREKTDDTDLMLYSGGFFSQDEKRLMAKILETDPSHLVSIEGVSRKSRLGEMLFRYRARNFRETLNETELTEWKTHCQTKLLSGSPSQFEKYIVKVDELQERAGVPSVLYAQLMDYGNRLTQELRS